MTATMGTRDVYLASADDSEARAPRGWTMAYSKGQEAVNTVNRSAAQRQLPALSPLHDTFRTGRYYKKNWTSR